MCNWGHITETIPIDYYEAFESCSQTIIEQTSHAIILVIFGILLTGVGSIIGICVSINEIWRQKAKEYDNNH